MDVLYNSKQTGLREGAGCSCQVGGLPGCVLCRFVRETGHFTMCTVCEALRGPALAAMSPRVAELLADGMGDNWSQVCGVCAGVGGG